MTEFITLSRKARDLTGQRFDRLIARGPVGQRKNSEIMWLCHCDCGNEITTRGSLLTGGGTRSCGCLAIEGVRARNRIHGLYGTAIHSLWRHMLGRCYDPSSDSYPDYGGRNIQVCEEWREDIQSFYAYVSSLEGYGEEGLSLDRIDVDGNYEPGNVRWATAIQQGRNRRKNRLLTFAGKTQCLAAWSEELGIDEGTLSYRLKHGWSVDRALSTAVRRHMI